MGIRAALGQDASGPPDTGAVFLSQWIDPTVEAHGHRVDSLYVETFWLPVLGPTAYVFLRRCAMLSSAGGRGAPVEVTPATCARWLGVGSATGKNSPFGRAVERCVRFGAARWEGPDRLAVRRVLAPLPERHAARLEPHLQELRRCWPPRSAASVGPEGALAQIRRVITSTLSERACARGLPATAPSPTGDPTGG